LYHVSVSHPNLLFLSLKHDLFLLKEDPFTNVVKLLKHGPQSLKLSVLQLKHGLVHWKHGPFNQEYCSLIEGVASAPIFWLNCFAMFQWFHHDLKLVLLLPLFHQINSINLITIWTTCLNCPRSLWEAKWVWQG
jgi:hypothetical protein